MDLDAEQARGEVTRADLLAVGRRLFSQHGYHHTGIKDIHSAAGITKGAFYHHFKSKEDLALAVLETVQRDYAEHLFVPAMRHKSPGARVAALLDGVVALNSKPEWACCQMMATLCADLAGEEPRLLAAAQQMVASTIKLWREEIAAAQAAGEADDRVDAATWAQWIVNTLTGTWIARKVGGAPVDAAQVVAAIKRLLLKPNPSGPGPT